MCSILSEEGCDSRSISSLTTVPVWNRTKVSTDNSIADKVPHNDDEKHLSSLNTDPSHSVGPGHMSLFSGHGGTLSELTSSSSGDELDEDLRHELVEAVKEAKRKVKEAKKKIKKKQLKRNLERAIQKEHEDGKIKKPRRDDDKDGDGNGHANLKPAAAAAAAAK